MNSRNLTARDRAHLGRVKEQPCAVCEAPPPSEAHHLRQGEHFTAVALCPDCHRGPLGWHGTRALWRIRKLDELDALNTTLRSMLS